MTRGGAPSSTRVRDPELLRVALDATGLLIAIAEESGRVVQLNRALEELVGQPADAATIWDLIAFETEREFLRSAFSRLKTGSFPPGMVSHIARGQDGELHAVDWSATVLRERDPVVVVFSGVDLSQRMRTEVRLREIEARERLLLESLPAVVWTTDTELRFTSSAGAGLSALALAAGQVSLVGTSLYRYVGSDDPTTPVIAAHLRALRGEQVALDVAWFGRTFQACIEPLADESGRLLGCIGVALDITERAAAERALRESEARFRRIFDSNMIGILFSSRTGEILECNRALLDLLGVTAEDVRAGRVSWRRMTPAEYTALDDRAMDEARATGTCLPYEKELVRSDGTRIPVLVGGASLGAGPERAEAGMAFVLDLREQVRLRSLRDEAFAREQRARIETERANARILLLAETSKLLAATMRPEETLDALARAVVPALADWSVVVQSAPEGPRCEAAAHRDPARAAVVRALRGTPVDAAAPEGAARVLRTGEAAVYANIEPEGDGRGLPFGPPPGASDLARQRAVRELGMRSLLCVPVRGRDGVEAAVVLAGASNPARYDRDDVLLAQEIANRASVSLENGRLLREALEAVQARDEFLSVAAHELRTPLTSTLLQIQGLQRAIETRGLDKDTLLRSLKISERQARRLSSLVDGLVDVSRAAAGGLLATSTREVDLAQVVRDAAGAMSGDLQRAGCAIDVVTPATLTGVYDRGRMEQVVMNLLSNAIKFGLGRPIEVRLEPWRDGARLSVRDQGIGIAPEDQARIFGRFERAVSSRHFGGLGLGLYVVAQIVRAHGGSIRVESEPGKGACFIVELPRRA